MKIMTIVPVLLLAACTCTGSMDITLEQATAETTTTTFRANRIEITGTGSDVLTTPGVAQIGPLGDQNQQNLNGIMWATGDVRTDGNLEAFSPGDVGNVELAGDVLWKQPAGLTPNVTAHCLAAEAGAASQNITISAAGSTGFIALNGPADVGTNTGAGGVKLYAGGGSTSVVWSTDGAGTTSQAGDHFMGGTLVATGSVRATTGFVDAAQGVYADGDHVWMNKNSIGFDFATTADTDDAWINKFGANEAALFFRGLYIGNGKAVYILHFNALQSTVEVNGHFVGVSTAPTVGACGTSPVQPVGSDLDFYWTTGTGGTSCGVTFAKTFTVKPACTFFTEGSATLPTCTISATGVACSVTQASTTYHGHCLGVTGST